MMIIVILSTCRRDITIFNRLGETAALTEPLAKIDQLTTFVAEGPPLGFRTPGDQFSAIRASNRLRRGIHVRRSKEIVEAKF